ncbi:MAG: beta-N-acetylhexosaminidase [Cyanobacteria bacterium SZAS TMP-1]|nr:beta-N-acetylhexosaminidase [Cyanobacteria bacterium SZAS TMP-1]
MRTYTGGEFIIMGVPGYTLDQKTIEIIKEVKPAGFILFARNIKTPEQLRALTDDLRAHSELTPFITIDQEGGRVSRLKEFAVEPPSAKALTDFGDVQLIADHGRITGKLLKLFGFNLNLAPVLDVLVNEKNENSLKGRTYGSTPDQVVRNATAFSDSMTAEGILCCGKHYPGYSMANVDPHNDLPSVDRTKEELISLEWQSFKRMLPKLHMVMVGHVSYPQIDASGLPATLSRVMVHQVLREEWSFEGCTITDDMDMGAIKSKYGSSEAAVQALEAGNDLMLVCHSLEAVPQIASALAAAPRQVLDQSFDRISALRARLVEPQAFSLEAFEALNQDLVRLRAAVPSYQPV